MMRFKRFAAVLLVVLMLCLHPAWTMLAQAEAAGGLTVYSSLDEISAHGSVRLVKDRRILLRDLEDAGIELGDIVKVTFLDREMDVPVGTNFSEVATGEALLRVKDDAVELVFNMGDFASEYIADPMTAEDGSVTWAYKEGVAGPVEFRIDLIKKGDVREEDRPVQLTYTDVRSDYPNLSDAAFANFRMIDTTGMGEGALYRTASPIDPRHGRSTYADAALKMAGVATVMNLVDSREAAEGYEGYGESYYSTTDHIALGMGMTIDTEEFRSKLAEGLRFFGSHGGPYAVHCKEGKDRTGVVAALLECFMGASLEEVRDDYMTTFYNYYGIRSGDEAYEEISEHNIFETLRKLFGTGDLGGVDPAGAAEDYFRKIGLSDDEIDSVRSNLGRSYLAGSSRYADMENWAYYGVGEDKEADIFIVAPTAGKHEGYNMTLDVNGRFRITCALNMEKGIYEDGLRMFAPYYAQASFGAYDLTADEREPYLQIAYSDVSEAFRYYLEHEDQGRPIVLFGYSQGGDHVYRLLKEYFGEEGLYRQLIAAYAIGWGCTFEEAERYPQIVPAAGEDDTGCVISYEAEAPAVEDSLTAPKGERHLAINPLNWKTDATPADRTENKGAVFVTNDLAETEAPQLCGAYLDMARGGFEGDGCRSRGVFRPPVQLAGGILSRL